MAFLAQTLDRSGGLQELWEERSNSQDFKNRDAVYKLHEAAYQSRSADGERQNITWRPIMLDGQVGGGEGREPLNLTKQIGLHHTSAASKVPRTWNEPGSLASQETAAKNTQLLQMTFGLSSMRLLQVRQAYNVSVLGDAVYGVVFDTRKDARRNVWVRVAHPSHCYPGLDDQDLGRLVDNLITYEVRRGWAEKRFGVELPGTKSTVRVFEYWDDQFRLIQIDKQVIGNWRLEHNHGFVPWYWCFNQVPGMFAQADVSETPKLQGTMNDLFLLAMDAMRRNVDKSYYATGHRGTVNPQPGKVVGFPNPNVKVDEFPTAVPPAMITQLMTYIQGNAQSMAGISPISMEGLVEGSNVTGSAIRHQVEAIEARAEAKRANLESAFAWLGESILKVYAQWLADHEFLLRVGGQEIKHTGAQVGDWTRCLASYGSFEGLPTMDRANWAMTGLGRVHGRRTAIQLAYPERDTDQMESEVDDYQLHQAQLSARAQAAAQEVMQSGQGEPGAAGAAPQAGGQPGPALSAPQLQQRHPVPGAALTAGASSTLSDLRLMLQLAKGRLKGDVYAVGEMAITGMAVAPQIAVTEEQDKPIVQAVLQPRLRNAQVRVGVQDDESKVLLNDA